MLQTITGQWAEKPGAKESMIWEIGQTPENTRWEMNYSNKPSTIIYFAVGK